MQKKLVLLALPLLVALGVLAQTSVSYNRVEAKDTLKLHGNTVGDISLDATFASASDKKLASQKAIYDFVQSVVASGGALKLNISDTAAMLGPYGAGVTLGLPSALFASSSYNFTLGGKIFAVTTTLASQSAFTVFARGSGSGTPTFQSIDTTFIASFYTKVRSLFTAGTGITITNGTVATTVTQYTDALARAAISETVTGLDYSSSTGVLSLTSGYVIPTTTQETNWTLAYTQTRQWDGGSTGLVAATGRTSLGATTVGGNLFTLTNPSAITFLRVNADNTVSALDAATFRTAIGAGTGSGSVTSVALTVPTGLSISGSPVTGSGTLAVTFTSGYSIPTTASQTNWDAAYNDKIASITFSASTLTLTQQDGGTVTQSVPTWNQNTTGNAATATAWNTWTNDPAVFTGANTYVMAYNTTNFKWQPIGASTLNTFLGGPFLPLTAGASYPLTGNLLPGTNATYDFGSSSLRWATVYSYHGNFNGNLTVGGTGVFGGNITVADGQSYVFGSGTTAYINGSSASNVIRAYTANTLRLTIDQYGTSTFNKQIVVNSQVGNMAVVMGGSGGDYGSVGYNVDYTTTTGSYLYKVSDYASFIKFQAGGFQFYGSVSGTAGASMTPNLAAAISNDGKISAYQITLGSVAGIQSLTALVGAVNNGDGLEFGHGNPAGYRGHLGAQSSSGQNYLVFHGEHGTNANTFRTRGIRASIIIADASGGFGWGNVSNTNADNQTFVQRMGLDNNGNLNTAGDITAEGNLTFKNTGYIRYNNTYWYGRNSADNAWKQLIGINTSDRVSIDGNSIGTTFGGILYTPGVNSSTSAPIYVYGLFSGNEMKAVSAAGIQSFLGLNTAAYVAANQNLNTSSNVTFNLVTVSGSQLNFGSSSYYINNDSELGWYFTGLGYLKTAATYDANQNMTTTSNVTFNQVNATITGSVATLMADGILSGTPKIIRVNVGGTYYYLNGYPTYSPN